MLTIMNLFGRSPFAPLKSHMEKVSECVHFLLPLFEAILVHDYLEVERITHQISESEHLADATKNDIREHLPRSLFLPIDRSHLLEILRLQDEIADQAEDIAILTTLKKLELPSELTELFNIYLQKSVETYEGARAIIRELHELLESSFGGIEAEKVRGMVDEVAFKEHEVRVLLRQMLKALFALEDSISYSSFHLWVRIFEEVAALAHLSEKVALRVRLTLETR
ncbi:MAG: TIGR00153 family protein [Chlamydiales bacterium]|nr:TIGR00153 family protein [Chlamydiales bacterium]